MIKSGDDKVMDVITYAEIKCTEATLKHDDCYEEMADASELDDWLAEDVEQN